LNKKLVDLGFMDIVGSYQNNMDKMFDTKEDYITWLKLNILVNNILPKKKEITDKIAKNYHTFMSCLKKIKIMVLNWQNEQMHNMIIMG